MKRIYKIEGCNETFSTLKEVKEAINDYFTPNERIKYLYGTNIACYVGNELISLTPVVVLENGGVKYGKTFSVK